MEVYRIAKGWRWFIFLISPVIIGLCSWFLLAPIIPGADHLSGNAYLITAPVLVGAIILFLIALSDTVKLRFVIDRDQVYTISTFSKRQLMFDEIKGYRATDKYLIIENPEQKKKRKLKSAIILKNKMILYSGLITAILTLTYENLKRKSRKY